MLTSISVNQVGCSRHEQGAIAITFAILLPFILAAAALAIDFGQMYVIRAELQNSADACALAAIQELISSPSTTAEVSAASAVGVEAGKRNTAKFQKLVITNTVQVDTTSAGAPFTTCTASYAYTPTFLDVAGFTGNATITASAKAGNVPGSDTCALPIATCGAIPSVGQWYTATTNPSGNNATGNTRSARWVTLGSQSSSGKTLISIMEGSPQCKINYATETVALYNGGTNANLGQSYNTRFGLYKGSSNSGIADYTGYILTSLGSNAYSTFITRRRTFDAPQSFSGYKSMTSAQLKASGASRRIAIVPHFTACGSITTTQQKPNSWDCVLMVDPIPNGNGSFNLEYLGDYKSTACKQSRLAGGTSATNSLVSALVE